MTVLVNSLRSMSHDGNSEEFRGDTENRITSAKDEQLNQKILARKERNRASALKSRLRKQEHVESMLLSNSCPIMYILSNIISSGSITLEKAFCHFSAGLFFE